MLAEIAIAGSGGQGVLFIGRLLAEAGLLEGTEVVWLPRYGAEKRGGTVSCDVIISDEKIGALVTARPTAAIAMTMDALSKLEPAMRPESLLVVNQSLISTGIRRDDVRAIYIPANDLATELGDDSAGNLVALGAMVAGFPVVSISSIIAVMDNMLSGKQERLEMNKLALNKGHAYIR